PLHGSTASEKPGEKFDRVAKGVFLQDEDSGDGSPRDEGGQFGTRALDHQHGEENDRNDEKVGLLQVGANPVLKVVDEIPQFVLLGGLQERDREKQPIHSAVLLLLPRDF